MNLDLEWALETYSRLAYGGEGVEERMFYLVVNGEPWSKQRPRFDRKRGRTYQPGPDAKAEAAMRTFLRSRNPKPFLGNTMLACLFYRSNYQRIDADNLLKHVSDSATGVLWADDSQVTLALAEVMLDAERPRTVIVAGYHLSSLRRGSDLAKPCAECGEPFTTTGGHHEKRFCSAACSYRARTTRLDPRDCQQCGDRFAPKVRTQIFCSRGCAVAATVAKRRGTGRPFSRCAECDAELAHHRGGRCRACWRANPGFYDPKPADPVIEMQEALL